MTCTCSSDILYWWKAFVITVGGYPPIMFLIRLVNIAEGLPVSKCPVVKNWQISGVHYKQTIFPLFASYFVCPGYHIRYGTSRVCLNCVKKGSAESYGLWEGFPSQLSTNYLSVTSHTYVAHLSMLIGHKWHKCLISSCHVNQITTKGWSDVSKCTDRWLMTHFRWLMGADMGKTFPGAIGGQKSLLANLKKYFKIAGGVPLDRGKCNAKLSCT